jgi:hypothetical protein
MTQPDREADHSPPSSGNGVVLPLPPHTHLRGVMLKYAQGLVQLHLTPRSRVFEKLVVA